MRGDTEKQRERCREFLEKIFECDMSEYFEEYFRVWLDGFESGYSEGRICE